MTSAEPRPGGDDVNEAGWYPDPAVPRQMRHWDGSAWTKHHRPSPPPPRPGSRTTPLPPWLQVGRPSTAVVAQAGSVAVAASVPTYQPAPIGQGYVQQLPQPFADKQPFAHAQPFAHQQPSAYPHVTP